MGKDSKIGWTNHTWNPVIGCHKVSPGCKNCYAERLVERMGKNFREIRRASDKTFFAPLRWKEPALVFTPSLSDLFLEQVDSFRSEIFEIIWNNRHLTFLLLTKRIERVNSCLLDLYWPSGNPMSIPPNIWIGTSVENQELAVERIPHLLNVPGAVRFLSCEPLLGPIDLTPWLPGENLAPYDIDWVIDGGESGPKNKIRPAEMDWFRSLRDQCVGAGIPYNHKQNGGFTKLDPLGNVDWKFGEWGGRTLDGRIWDEFPHFETLENFQS